MTGTRPRCPNCGAPNSASARYCQSCGWALGAVPVYSSRSRLAAALLAILLGGLGIHKFYTGRTLLGIVYLLFCWTFIPAILGFFEGIWYLTISDEDFAMRYP